MTKLDPSLPMSKARSQQFYNLVKSQTTMSRWAVIESMNMNVGLFQREYTGYLQKYPQIKYLKETKEFVFDP
ncbi:MAG: hypothetical protein OES34_12215 [Nitrosopumilus sp.]|nr:hypothetical protein [Nitrosopumilus sp.]